MLQIKQIVQKTKPENPHERIITQTLKEVMSIINEAQDDTYKSGAVKENYRDSVLVSIGMLEMLKRYGDISDREYKHLSVMCKRLIKRQEVKTA